MASDHVSELQPPTGILLMPQMIYEHGVSWWNYNDRGNRRTRRKIYPSTPLSKIPHILTDPGLLGERLAFLNLFTLEEPLKYFSGLREPLHKNYYIYSSRYEPG
jgi:hypothetical protein